MATRIGWGVCLTLLVTAVALGGCTGMEKRAASQALPPAKALGAGDLASLAGEWHGTLRGVGSAGPLPGRTANLRVTVAPDGSFTSNIDGTPGVGKGRIENGKVVFEGSTARGTGTLHEGGGQRVLVGQGTWVGFEGQAAFELTKR
jgi:hypothetical protein